jgi:hypothetical protein
VRSAGAQPAFEIAWVPASVRGDDDLDARRPDRGEQVADVLVQADGFGHFSQPRIDLAVVGEEVVIRVDEDECGPGGVISGRRGHQSGRTDLSPPVA